MLLFVVLHLPVKAFYPVSFIDSDESRVHVKVDAAPNPTSRNMWA